MNLERKRIDKIFIQINKIGTKGKDSAIEYYKYIDDMVTRGDYDNLLQCLYYYYDIDTQKFNTVEEIKKKTWKEVVFRSKSTFDTKLKKLYDNRGVYQTSFNIFSYDNRYFIMDQSDTLSSTYSTISSTQSISFVNTNGVISINTYPGVYSIRISKAIWATQSGVYKPTNITDTQLISVTQSSVITELTKTYIGEYLITTEERPNYKLLNYRLKTSNNSFLGELKEVYTYTDETKYYVKNKQFTKVTGTRKSFIEVTKVSEDGNIYATSSVMITENNPAFPEDQNLYNRYVLALDMLLL